MIDDMLHTLQSESEQRPHKLSYIVSVKGDAAEKTVSQLEDKLQAAGMISSNSCTNVFCSSTRLNKYVSRLTSSNISPVISTSILLFYALTLFPEGLRQCLLNVVATTASLSVHICCHLGI